KSLELLLTYPFPNGAMDAVEGDFTNLDVTLDVNTQKALKDLHLPTASIPVPTISIPTLPTALPTSLPTLIPTTAPTALCVTILVPINCPASSGGGGAPAAAAPDGGLAGLMMPGVAP
ncbi:MAG TPA: mammalian cell entry protein, partial [Kribbellaceae bacterium]